MFGYILPRKDKLSQEDRERYHGAYCGLCRSLKGNYGFKARFLVNYDMTFLYILLKQGKREEMQRCFCPAHPFCKKDCLPSDQAMEYAADMTVLLSVWKLRDALEDGGLFRRMGARAGLLLYRGAYRKAAQKQQEADKRFGRQLDKLRELEKNNCPSLDRAADAFAALLGGCLPDGGDEEQRRIAGMLLYHVGRFLYLVDALEDLPGDNRRKSYNPLRYRYSLEDGKLSGEDREQFLETVDASVSMAASALELLPQAQTQPILRNIIYYGMPAVLHSVADGTFRKRGIKHERSL